uniref:Phospholipase/carboxylesterase/thioesterase domain-containing protein n=1 Tax=viral metagenome TaxID=1070528 RepID=A0A6C0AY52_9ZZZZ|tara:strand:+ start:486 stop:1163 length:678 start_codon:yes stop_codon:yes gene_type:complete
MNNDYIFFPEKKHKYTIILLHGMNTTNNSLILLTHKIIKKYKNIKIILPNSPKRTINWYEEPEENVSSWYNYFTCNNNKMEHDTIDIQHFYEQVERINKIINKEIKLLDNKSENIIIGGISQGGTLAFHIGLNYHSKLGGIIGIHTVLMNNVTQISKNTQDIPIYLFSGEKDEIYNIKLQRKSLKVLRKLKYKIIWNIQKKLKHCEYCKKENSFIIQSIKDIIIN